MHGSAFSREDALFLCRAVFIICRDWGGTDSFLPNPSCSPHIADSPLSLGISLFGFHAAAASCGTTAVKPPSLAKLLLSDGSESFFGKVSCNCRAPNLLCIQTPIGGPTAHTVLLIPSSGHHHHLLLPSRVAAVTKAGGRALTDTHTKACMFQRAACRGIKHSCAVTFPLSLQDGQLEAPHAWSAALNQTN